MERVAHIIDVYHGDEPVDFHAMAAAGAVGVILKSSQGCPASIGKHSTDPRFLQYRERALQVFDAGCVHSYHFLDGSRPEDQIAHYLHVTEGMSGRWLDYEKNRNPHGSPLPGGECSLEDAVRVCHILEDAQGRLPGIYGSDLLGIALLSGHFTICPLWIARYSHKPPVYPCDLWQFQGAEINPEIPVGGKMYDLSVFVKGDAAACKAWMQTLAQ